MVEVNNTLANILPKILASGLMTLREQAVMPRLVNGDYSNEAAQKGDTIDVPIPTAMAVTDITPAETGPSVTNWTPDKVQIQLNNWKGNQPFGLSDQELNEIARNAHFMPMQMAEAVRAVANEINQSVHALYKKVPYVVGDGGAVPFGTVAPAVDARKQLHVNVAPRSQRRGVVSYTQEAAMLSLSEFSDVEKIGTDQVRIEGEIGRKYGIDWVGDDHVVSHTFGTITGTTQNDVGAAEPVGETAIGIDCASGGGIALLDGDIITFGDGHTYAVNGDVTIAATNSGVVTIYHGLKAALAGGEIISWPGNIIDNADVADQGLVFHRDAFALAMRPLLSNTQFRASRADRMMSVQDPITGLILRLEMIEQYKQTVWQFDALWGVELVRPELACRVISAT